MKRLYHLINPNQNSKDKKRLLHLGLTIKFKLKKAYNDYLSELLDGTDENNNNKLYKFLKSRKRENLGIPPLLNKAGETITDTAGKAEILNEQYSSVFTQENQSVPTPATPPAPSMTDIQFTENGIQKLLHKLNPKKANVPDQIPIKFLREHST